MSSACILLGVSGAFAVTRTDLPGRRFFGVLAALPLAVPTYVAAFGWVSTFNEFEGFWPAALVLTLCCYPYVYLPVAGSLVGADPAQEEVSRSLGRGPMGTFLGVTVRQVRPAIMAGALLVALYVLSDFGAVSILRADTFTRAIFIEFELGFDRTGALVLSTVLIALTVVLLVAENLTRRRRARYAPVGAAAQRPHPRVRLGWLRWPIAGLLVSLGVVAEAEQHSQPCGVDDVDLTEIQHDLSGSCRPQLPNLFCEPVGRREVKFAHRSDRHLVAVPHDSTSAR